MSEMYEGAQPWKDLKTKRRALNLILYFMGSQWSETINWSLFTFLLGRPLKREL